MWFPFKTSVILGFNEIWYKGIHACHAIKICLIVDNVCQSSFFIEWVKICIWKCDFLSFILIMFDRLKWNLVRKHMVSEKQPMFDFCRAHRGGGRLRDHFGVCPSVRPLHYKILNNSVLSAPISINAHIGFVGSDVTVFSEEK